MIETLGDIGDFLGGIGVVITLIYLAGQIRQNTRSIRMSAFQAAQRDIADILDGLSKDPELIRLYFDGNHKFESFSKQDRRRYATFMSGWLRRYETLLYHTRHGNIDREQWEGVLTELRTAFKYPGARAWWSQARTRSIAICGSSSNPRLSLRMFVIPPPDKALQLAPNGGLRMRYAGG